MNEWWIAGTLVVTGSILFALSYVYLARRRPHDPIPMGGGWTPWRKRLVGAEVLRVSGFAGLIFGAITVGRGLIIPLVAAAVFAVGALPALVVCFTHNARLKRRNRSPSRK